LLYFDEIVYPLSKQIKQVLDEKGIPFTNSATTNGYLIDKERINKFKEINLNHFQITLDGNQATHDKIGFGRNREGSFKTAKYYFEVLKKLSVLIEKVQSPAFTGRLLESCFSAGHRPAVMKITSRWDFRETVIACSVSHQ
jgi:uncharacterized protein